MKTFLENTHFQKLTHFKNEDNSGKQAFPKVDPPQKYRQF